MKHTFFFISWCASLLAASTGCGSAQSDAVKQADAIQQTVKANTPGAIQTSKTGYYMTAKIDGKEWSASHMMPYDESGSYLLVFGEKDGDRISFQLWKRGVNTGKKFPFSDDHAADLSLEDISGFFGGRSGF